MIPLMPGLIVYLKKLSWTFVSSVPHGLAPALTYPLRFKLLLFILAQLTELGGSAVLVLYGRLCTLTGQTMNLVSLDE